MVCATASESAGDRLLNPARCYKSNDEDRIALVTATFGRAG